MIPLCKATEKLIFLTEGACVVAIRMEGKYYRVAPYVCPSCGRYHMTSNARSLGRYYQGKRAGDER